MLDDLDFAIAYLDDIIIIRKSKEQHREHVRSIHVDTGVRFKVKEEKCEFFLEIKYLGHIIDKDGRIPTLIGQQQ